MGYVHIQRKSTIKYSYNKTNAVGQSARYKVIKIVRFGSIAEVNELIFNVLLA